ncbi:MAG: dipeptide/oligopeptide/nickel ABC transporter ATP-binding protein [Candidatus Marinimicrobia bacterium]|nr:dipeptide/oligopeptide/nickel ABC transporter ATP-binding protein [Candidatus Neomarinimicrobiota bacterium]
MHKNILSLENVFFYREVKTIFSKYTKTTILQNITFGLEKGKTLGIIGESGSGKSTLLGLIQGLLQLKKGKIIIDSIDITTLSNFKLSLISQIIFQNVGSCFNPRLSIENILEEPLNIHKIDDKRGKIYKVLNLVELPKTLLTRNPKELSGGQLQRINIARSLLLDPKIILCDEIVSSLDISVQAQVLNTLNMVKDELGMSFIFVSHDINVTKYMSDEILVLKDGKIYDRFDTKNNDYSKLKPYTTELASQPF